MLDPVPGRVERVAGIEQTDPESGQGADPPPRPPSAPRISRKLFSRTSGKAVDRWSVQSASVGVSPGSTGNLPSRKSRKLRPPRRYICRRGRRSTSARRAHSRSSARSRSRPRTRTAACPCGRVGVFPDVAAEALEAVGLALGERRIGEQRGRDRLQREADAELLHHVGFGRIVEIDLDGAGAQHHVEAELADPRHVSRMIS